MIERIAGVALAASAVWITYTYAGYPLLLWLLGRLRPARPVPDPVRQWPRITVVIPVYNGAAVIGPTLEGVLALDYPGERPQVIVVSDASTDGTDEIVQAYARRGVELLRLEQRAGKTAAENAARDRIRGDIVINTDVTIRLDPRAARRLVAAFADPAVGVASGRDVSVGATATGATVGESGYVGYEMWVRDLETRVGGIVGASGSLYAIRRDLHVTFVPAALSRDFAAPLIAREHGYRAVSVPEALCFVPRTGSLRQEYRRKVRTMTRGVETLWYKRHLLNPRRYGLFAWMLFSHKLCRWLVPWAAVLGFVAGVVLMVHPLGRWLIAGTAAAAGLALGGWLWPPGQVAPLLLSIPAYLAASTVAGLHAWVNALRGELNAIWEPTRRPSPPGSDAAPLNPAGRAASRG